ncbi:MAG: hypothetical protein AAF318_08370 [Pseudomonadota bacterium]
MTTDTLHGLEPKTLADRLEGTALDVTRGKRREYRVTYFLTVTVLLLVFAAIRLVTFASATGPRRSIVSEAHAAASSALAYAYRH